MRVHRSIQVLAILTTIAACSSPGETANAQQDAATPAAAPAPAVAAVSVEWDSGPLDRAYHAERVDLDAKHAREIARPTPGESADQRLQRQANENQALELRYTRGKASHASTMPPAER